MTLNRRQNNVLCYKQGYASALTKPILFFSETLTKNGGDITITTPGIHVLSCQLFVENSSQNKQNANLLVNINDERTGTFQSVATLYKNSIVSLTINGIVKVIDRTIVRVYIENESRLKILNGSRLIIDRVSATGYQLQAFSVQMKPKVWGFKLNRLNSVSFEVWSSQENRNSFIDTNLFVPANGVLVAESDGIFLISTNIMLLSGEDKICKNTLIVKTNGNQNNTIEVRNSKPNERFTISLIRFLRLSKSDRLWMEITSTCDKVRVYPESTFSCSQISGTVHRATLSSPDDVSLKNNVGWSFFNLSIFKPIDSTQDHDENGFQLGLGNISCQTNGVVYVSIHLDLIKPSILSDDAVVKLAATKNHLLKKDGPDDIFASAYARSRHTMQPDNTRLELVTRLQVKKADILGFNIFLPKSSGKWILLNESKIYVTIISNEEPQRSNQSSTDITLKEEWSPLANCIPIHSENVKVISESLYDVVENGVYIFSANFEIVDIEDNTDLELALIYKSENNQQKTLLYSMESGVTSSRSVKQASTLKLRSGNGFQFFIRSVGSQPQIIKGACSFDLKFLGDHSSMVGFQANLKKDFIIQGNTGYFTINNFQNLDDDPKFSSLSYNTYKGFNHAEGVFKAPFRGIYMVSLNLVAKHLIMTSNENYAVAMIKINSNDSAFFSLKQHKFRSTSTDDSLRNTTTSFCVTGPVYLNDHDEVKIEFFVNGDDRWEIDARSSFSMVLMTQQLNGFLVHRPSVNKVQPIENTKESIVSGWEEMQTSPPYGGFVGTTKSSPTIQKSGVITFAVDGWYTISINILLKQHITKDALPEITLKLVRELTYVGGLADESPNEIHCDRLVVDFEVTPCGCQLTRRFNQGDSYTIRILRDDSVISSNDFYNSQTNDQNMAYLSVLLLDEAVNFQSGMLNLQVNL